MTTRGTAQRITLVIPAIVSGGAERVMATLANRWAADGRAITLLTLDDGREPPFFPLHPDIDHRSLGIAGASGSALPALKNNLRRIVRLRRAIAASEPDLVLSFLDTTNVLTLLATRGLGVPVVVEEHTDPSQKSIGRWEPLRRRLYPRAGRVVVLSEESRAAFGPAIRGRTVVMPNPIVVDPPSATAPRGDRRTLIAVGRLGPEKGFDLLLDAFARLAPDHPEWDLVIWGEGQLRAELDAQRHRLGLDERARLPGRTSSPHAELRKADLFVMSSRREGFPMALGEAMACGLPAVSTDCPSGPRQVIRHGIDGILVPPDDPAALAAALDDLMRDTARRARLAARAPEVLDRFGIERICARWDELFAEVVTAQNPRRHRGFRTFGSARTGSPAPSRSYDAGR